MGAASFEFDRLYRTEIRAGLGQAFRADGGAYASLGSASKARSFGNTASPRLGSELDLNLVIDSCNPVFLDANVWCRG